MDSKTTTEVFGIILILAGILGGLAVRRWSSGSVDYPALPWGLLIAFIGLIMLVVGHSIKFNYQLADASPKPQLMSPARDESPQKCYCWNCGAENRADQTYCTKCGRRLLYEQDRGAGARKYCSEGVGMNRS